MPLPVPVLLTVRVTVCVSNVAVTVVAAVTVPVRAPVPAQPAPLQPVKVDPPAGVAVKITTVPLSYAAEHIAPQSIPAGLEVTLPLPIPVGATVRVNRCAMNVAVTVVGPVIVDVQVPVPEQAP